MKKEEYFELHADFCKTFTNPKRIEILHLLRAGEMNVTAIQKKIGESKAHTSLMLSVMRMRGVVKARRAGTNTYYSIADEKIADACVVMQEALAGVIGKKPTARSIRKGG